MGYTGLEPVTLRLRGACSTIELIARIYIIVNFFRRCQDKSLQPELSPWYR